MLPDCDSTTPHLLKALHLHQHKAVIGQPRYGKPDINMWSTQDCCGRLLQSQPCIMMSQDDWRSGKPAIAGLTEVKAIREWLICCHARTVLHSI